MEGKYIIVAGPVIIEEGKLLVIKDGKDDFYKLPGGTIEEGETAESACIRETKEEIGADIEIISPLSPILLWENPKTQEKMTLVLLHFFAKLKNTENMKAIPPIKEIEWLDIESIEDKMESLAPNLKMLVNQGEIY